MRSVAAYVEDVLAQGAPVLAIVAETEGDDASFWWEIRAVLEKADPPSPKSRSARQGRFLFTEYLVEMPPDELDAEERKRTGSLVCRVTSGLPHDLDGVERDIAMNLGQAIARELQVPFYVSPMERDGRYVSWWEQDQCAELGRLLEQCRAAVVVTGDTLSPIPFHRPRPGEGPADLDLHWKRLLRSHDELVRASPRSAHIGIRRLHEAGRLAGAIAEVGDGLIEATGIPPALVADIHGSVHTVRCIRCRAEGPAAPFVEPYRRTHEIPRCDCGGSLRPTAIELGEGVDRGATERAHRFIENADLLLTLGTDLEIDPSASSLIEAARSRRIPYVIVSYRGTRFDDGAALAIQGSADENLALAMRRLAS